MLHLKTGCKRLMGFSPIEAIYRYPSKISRHCVSMSPTLHLPKNFPLALLLTVASTKARAKPSHRSRHQITSKSHQRVSHIHSALVSTLKSQKKKIQSKLSPFHSWWRREKPRSINGQSRTSRRQI